MYEAFYGLSERAFELTPNPRFLLLTPTHREALNTLDYGISARKGITLLIGDAGTGKTTLIRKALAIRRAVSGGTSPDDRFVYVNNPKLTCEDFWQVLARQFELSAGAGSSKAEFLLQFDAALQSWHQAGAAAVLIIDEAQGLSTELLEEIRLLANMESETDKLLQLVLVGQPELGDRLAEPELRALRQRIALRSRLCPLRLQETASYIAGRLRLAGGDAARVFTRDAVMAIHGATRGIPRTISVVCDNALVAGYAADEQPVGGATVEAVCRDLELENEAGARGNSQSAKEYRPGRWGAPLRLAAVSQRWWQ